MNTQLWIKDYDLNFYKNDDDGDDGDDGGDDDVKLQFTLILNLVALLVIFLKLRLLMIYPSKYFQICFNYIFLIYLEVRQFYLKYFGMLFI